MDIVVQCKNAQIFLDECLDSVFFSFPRDPQRSALWLRNCGRIINTTTENLHKNYRICGNHFESSMFLNELKNRLQPHAFPIPSLAILKNQNSSNNDKIQLINSSSQSTNKGKQEDHQIQIDVDRNDQQENQQIQIDVDKKDQEIQTGSKLSNNSPRKQMLKKKIRLL